MTATPLPTAARPDTPRPVRFPRIVAHRGASGAAPENTLAAFRLAAAQGARGVEFDVSLLGDGTPVVCHDATLDRCTNRTGPIAAIGLGDLAGIDAGCRFGPAFAGERLPTLAAVLALLGELGLAANLEMKAHGAAPGPLAAAVAREVQRHGWTQTRLTVSSFDHGELVALRRLMPGCPLAVLYEAPAPDWRGFLASLDAEAMHLGHAELDAGILAAAAADGRTVRVYTVNDPASVLAFRDAGLGGLFTDHPPRFLGDPDWRAWDVRD
ncbi:MAG: glycerophosphodiester phosphodiesterase family protein [Thermohalobaculum sp.]|nr:glycerophosphodiester phosphodiesterase family protein [Thermohalobaculum sp.]